VVVRVQVLGESKEVIEYDINDVLMRGLNNILSEKHRSDKLITYRTASSGLVSLMGALESADLLSGNK
jgi:23S rRNA maturation mini-RNase III